MNRKNRTNCAHFDKYAIQKYILIAQANLTREQQHALSQVRIQPNKCAERDLDERKREM